MLEVGRWPGPQAVGGDEEPAAWAGPKDGSKSLTALRTVAAVSLTGWAGPDFLGALVEPGVTG